MYVTHFKRDKRRIVDCPNLNGLLHDICQIPEVVETAHMDHIRRHRFRSHLTINPRGIVPIEPALDFSAPHDREQLGKREIRGT